ncbi:MAG: hypothetical protein Q9188_006298, partial [Gyalolechia gomerana]
FGNIPGTASDDQGNERRQYELANGSSASVQLLEVHPIYRGCEVEGHINKGKDSNYQL